MSRPTGCCGRCLLCDWTLIVLLSLLSGGSGQVNYTASLDGSSGSCFQNAYISAPEAPMTIKEETVELQTPAGPMRTYIFRPAAEGKYPGLVLFSEIFQVTGPIRRTAALLAGHGF